MCNNPNLDFVNNNYENIQNLVKFYPFVLKILSISMHKQTTFGKILSICSQDIERKLKSNFSLGP